tara:strand:+ start:1760 stop:2365 length:606 start_codon:yes stop_codon:yes gene_type:complete
MVSVNLSRSVRLVKEYLSPEFIVGVLRDKKWDAHEERLKKSFKISYCPNGKYSTKQRCNSGVKLCSSRDKLGEFAVKWGYVKNKDEWEQEYQEFKATQKEFWQNYWAEDKDQVPVQGFLKSIKYLWAYYSCKRKFNQAKEVLCGEMPHPLRERGQAIKDVRKNIRHMSGLVKLLGHFDDPGSSQTSQRREFENYLLGKVNK